MKRLQSLHSVRFGWLASALATMVLVAACASSGATPGEGVRSATAPPPMHPAVAGRAGIAGADKRLVGMRTMSQYFPTRTIARAGQIHHFEARLTPADELGYEFEGQRYDAAQLADRNHATSLVILHDGVLVHEQYLQGTTDTTHLTSYSVAKSIVSILVGFAVGDGAIASLDDPVTRYLPEFAGTGYDGATVKHLLQMSSGVAFSEGYVEGGSDIYRLSGASLIMNQMPASQYMKTLKRVHPPGTAFNYSTGETHVLGLVVASAVGKPLSEYLEEKLWSKLGMEHDAHWILDRNAGDEFAGIGLNATARDFARIGQLMLQDGVWEQRRLLPEGWVEASTTPDAPHIAHGKVLKGQPGYGYGYQWWVHADGTYDAEGVFGQFIWVNPKDGIVIVKTSAWPAATDLTLKTELLAAFHAFSDYFAGRPTD